LPEDRPGILTGRQAADVQHQADGFRGLFDPGERLPGTGQRASGCMRDAQMHHPPGGVVGQQGAGFSEAGTARGAGVGPRGQPGTGRPQAGRVADLALEDLQGPPPLADVEAVQGGAGWEVFAQGGGGHQQAGVGKGFEVFGRSLGASGDRNAGEAEGGCFAEGGREGKGRGLQNQGRHGHGAMINGRMEVEVNAMSIVEEAVPPLVPGDFLSRDEFLRRWEAMPRVKRAELIGGVVYVPSPVSIPHGDTENDVGTWLGTYKAVTPGCAASNNATWLMEEDEAPQPDLSLRILPEYGGQSRREGPYAAGAPEFLAEVCLSRTACDLHQKLEVYQRNGVREYLAVLMREREVRWHQLSGTRFEVVPAPADGVYRSTVFPGLWLDAAALLRGDLARVLAVLNEGLASAEHRAFVEQLAARRQ
jgi:Uma2 family endonuclease